MSARTGMQPDLAGLLARLKDEQGRLIRIAAAAAGVPNRSTIQRIGELEQAIGAIEFAIGDRGEALAAE